MCAGYSYRRVNHAGTFMDLVEFLESFPPVYADLGFGGFYDSEEA
jgi:hypothetical protein